MAMRDLVTGGANCDPSASSSSNPLGALANALIGSSSQKERLQEIPTSALNTSGNNFYSGAGEPLSALPGSELEHPLQHQNSAFVNGFHAANDNRLSEVWDGIQNPQIPQFHPGQPQLQPELNGPPQRVLSSFLHAFVNSSHGGVPFGPTQLPVLGLSEGDKRCIRDRSSIMARHIFADKNEDFINGQVNALLSSLEIDNHALANRAYIPGRNPELEQYWNESQVMAPGPRGPDSWADEFAQNRGPQNDPNAWALSFERQHGTGGWASEFEHEQAQMTSVDRMAGANIPSLAAMEQTRMLAHTLAQNSNPKFQNSKFLQFVSKMSRGELTIEDNQVKPGNGDWANEFQQQYNAGPSSWADQYAHEQVSRGPENWASEFANERVHHGPVDEQWVDEFSKLQVNDWADEFGRQVGEGILGDDSADNWASAYDEYLNEQAVMKQKADSSRGVYEFSDLNPYVGYPDPMREGQELFRKGLLSEAVLALEAEVLKNPDNAEGWRLLGVAHAENDDDQQAIASMMRAQEADPTNLEVLLALGVSHTNASAVQHGI